MLVDLLTDFTCLDFKSGLIDVLSELGFAEAGKGRIDGLCFKLSDVFSTKVVVDDDDNNDDDDDDDDEEEEEEEEEEEVGSSLLSEEEQIVFSP